MQEKERAKDLVAAGKQCEAMATELLALAAGSDSAGKILQATDRRNVEFLDVLIENEQKEVIAHTVVQRYLQVTYLMLYKNNIRLHFVIFSYAGTLAWFFDMGLLENFIASCCLYCVSPCLDWFYLSHGTQIQQSTHHQVHVLSHLTYISYDSFEHCGYNAHLSSLTT